jgi:hypothetical protein
VEVCLCPFLKFTIPLMFSQPVLPGVANQATLDSGAFPR